MRLATKVRNPYNSDASIFVDIIATEPTTTHSRASLLLLNDALRWQEIKDLAEELNFDLTDERIKGYSSAKALIMAECRKRFMAKKELEGQLVCEYCKNKVYRDRPVRSARFATVDHKTPQVEGCDVFDESNFAVCCYRCNQKKNQIPYEEWCVIVKQMQERNKYELNRAAIITNFLNSSRISSILDDVNTNEHKLYQIANLTKISRDFLFKHLSNMDVDPTNIRQSKNDIKTLTRLNIVARHKANKELDLTISVDREFKEFFQSNKKWSVISNRVYI